MPFIESNPLNSPINSYDSIRRFVTNRAPTTADYKLFKLGDEWLDTSASEWWKLSYKDATQGIWVGMGGVGAVELVQGDTGAAVGPDAAETIHFLGNSVGFQNGIEFTGTPANNTMTAMDLRNITVYVVDAVAGQTEYQTIQAAVDAASADGGGTVYIRPGAYVEDLVLYSQVDLTGAVGSAGSQTVTITGTHVPPLAGAISFRNISFQEDTAIFNSAAAGTTLIVSTYCFFIVGNGYAFNIPNWVGLVAMLDCHSFGVQDGFIDIGAGGGTLSILNCTIGVGGTNIMAVSGATRINNSNIQCNIDTTLQGTTIYRSCQWNLTLLFSDDSNGIISQCICLQDVGTAINHTSTGLVSITNTTIESSGNPDVIAGTGDVQLDVVFTLSAAINAGITQLAPAYHVSGPLNIIPEDSSVAAEDAWIKFEIPATQGYSFGIDNTDDFMKMTDGIDPSNGNLMWSMTASGERTMPLQPTFLGFLPSDDDNAIGDATVYTLGGVTALTIIYDQNGDFTTTGVFTCPVTGKAHLNALIFATGAVGLLTGATIRIVTSNRTYIDKGGVNFAATTLSSKINVGADMDAADTAYVTITCVSGGGKEVDIQGAATIETYFNGCLLV